MSGSCIQLSGANSRIISSADPRLFPLASEPCLHPEWNDADKKEKERDTKQKLVT